MKPEMKWSYLEESASVTGVRPIQLFFQQGVSDLEKKAIREGISLVLENSGIYKTRILDSLGLYPSDLINLNLGVESASKIGKCLEQGEKSSQIHSHLNVNSILSELIPEKCEDYLILITQKPIYSDYPPDGHVHIYGATSKPASVISTSDFSKLNEQQKYFGLRALTIHELGHLIGNLPFSKEKDSQGKPRNTVDSYGLHCAEMNCSMNQSYSPLQFVERGVCIQGNNPLFCLDCTRGLLNSLMKKPSTQWKDFFSGYH